MKPAEPHLSDSHFPVLARLVDGGVLFLGSDRTLVFMNDRARALLHDAPDDPTACWSRLQPLVTPALDRADAAPSSSISETITVPHRGQQDPRQLRLDVYALPDATTHAGYLVLLSDYDALQRIEDHLRHAVQRHQMHRFYGAFAHDLRQPTGAALLHLKVLEEINDRMAHDDAQMQAHFAESLDTIRNEVQELDRSLRLLLHELAPSDAEEVVCLRTILHNAARLIEPQIRKDGLVLHTEFPDASLMVRGRHLHLQQAVLGLVLHALDRARTGTIALRLSVHGDRACVEVADEGPALSETARARLFEPPAPPEATDMRLDLYRVRQTARSHGGDIDVRSAPGEGTTRVLTLPLLAGDDA